MKLQGTRVVQDIDLEMSFDEFITISAKLGAIRCISQKGCWFIMTKDEMHDRRFMEGEIDLAHDLYFFWYKGSELNEESDDVETVEF